MTPANARKSEAGVAMIMVLALMVLAVPLVTAALSLASTLSLDSTSKTRLLVNQYGALGGLEYAYYRLRYESGYASGLNPGVGDAFIVTIGEDTVTVTILKVSEPPADVPPPSADNSRRLRATKTVAPATIPADTPTTLLYTITVENRDDQNEGLTQVYDRLPPGFVYVSGSTSGVTALNPEITVEPGPLGDQQLLRWEVSNLGVRLVPGESAQLQFSAQADVNDGNYCNEAWVDPGGPKTSTGLTAKVVAGAPSDSLCHGEAMTVAKSASPAVVPAGVASTVTYTIRLENTGTQALSIDGIRDLMPSGFTYVAGSTRGTMTTLDPGTSQSGQRLDWSFNPEFVLAPGQTAELLFDTQTTPAAGDYWNEAWVYVDEFADPLYTWPTALVQAMGVFETTATTDDSIGYAEVWLGASSMLITHLSIER